MRKKVINIVTTQFFPDNSSAADRINTLASVLSENNIVNVIYLTEADATVNFEKLAEYFNNSENLNFYPVPARKYNSQNFISRFFHEIHYCIKLNRKNRKIKTDLTLVSVPFLMLLPVTGWYALFLKRYFILDVRDITWNSISDGRKGFNLLSQIFEKIALWSARRFNYIVTTTESQKEYFEQHYENIPLKAIYNGVREERVDKLRSLTNNRKRDNYNFTVSYVGRIGFPQNLEVLIDCAVHLKDYKKVVFNIAGKGNELEKIKKRISKENLENVNYLGNLDWEEVKKLYEQTDLLYAQIKDTPSLRLALPVKVLEYAATGLPVVFAGAGESAKIVADFENFKLIEPDNSNLLKDTILEYHNRHLSVSEHDKQTVKEKFLREDLLKDYKLLVEKILQEQ